MGNIQPYYNGTGYGLNFIELLMIYNQMPKQQQDLILDHMRLQDGNPQLAKILTRTPIESFQAWWSSINNDIDLNGTHINEFVTSLNVAFKNDSIFKAISGMDLIEYHSYKKRTKGIEKYRESKIIYDGLFRRIKRNRSAKNWLGLPETTQASGQAENLAGIVEETRRNDGLGFFKYFEDKEKSIKIGDLVNELNNLFKQLETKKDELKILYTKIVNNILKKENDANFNTEFEEKRQKIYKIITAIDKKMNELQQLSTEKNNEAAEKKDSILSDIRKDYQDFINAKKQSKQLIESCDKIKKTQDAENIYGQEIMDFVNSEKSINNFDEIKSLLSEFDNLCKSRNEHFLSELEKIKEKLDNTLELYKKFNAYDAPQNAYTENRDAAESIGQSETGLNDTIKQICKQYYDLKTFIDEKNSNQAEVSKSNETFFKEISERLEKIEEILGDLQNKEIEEHADNGNHDEYYQEVPYQDTSATGDQSIVRQDTDKFHTEIDRLNKDKDARKPKRGKKRDRISPRKVQDGEGSQNIVESAYYNPSVTESGSTPSTQFDEAYFDNINSSYIDSLIYICNDISGDIAIFKSGFNIKKYLKYSSRDPIRLIELKDSLEEYRNNILDYCRKELSSKHEIDIGETNLRTIKQLLYKYPNYMNAIIISFNQTLLNRNNIPPLTQAGIGHQQKVHNDPKTKKGKKVKVVVGGDMTNKSPKVVIPVKRGGDPR